VKRQIQYLGAALIITLFNICARAQAPNISYTPSTSRFTTGATITPLIPVNSGGTITSGGFGAPFAFAPQIGSPYEVASDASGNIYVADAVANILYKITPTGTVSNFITGLNQPTGVAIDGNGNIYISNTGNSRVLKYNSSGGLLNTINIGTTAPNGIAFDAANNAYVACLGNGMTNNGSVIKINATTGTPSTAFSNLTNSYGIAIDPSGNTYVSLYSPSSSIIKYTSAGVKSTFVSSGLSGPRQMTCDAAGNLYVADYGNDRIVKYSPTAVPTNLISTVISSPRGVIFDPSGNAFVADYGNSQIVKLPLAKYSITPTLPTSLTFDVSTGEIAGSSDASFASTTYTISATNGSGTSTTTINLSCGTTKQWDGSSNTSWTTNANWTPNGAPDDGDDIELGTISFKNQPTFAGTDTYNSITFGNFNASVTPKVPITITIGATGGAGSTTSRTLTVTNNITVGTGSTIVVAGGGTGAAVESLVMAPGSMLTLTGTGKLTITTDQFTLQSDATGSASIGILTTPANLVTSGTTVNVERYLQGGSSSERGYRLMSSPVYVSGTNPHKYNLDYIEESAITTGISTGNGFDKAGNPTLFLFREDLAPSGAFFGAGDWPGVGKINNNPTYNLGINSATSNTMLATGTFNLTPGSGFLFFFRGDKKAFASTALAVAAETQLSYVPTGTTFTSTGVLNVGPVTTKYWLTPANSLGYTTGTNTAVRGYNLVGNPYPCSIDWDTFGSGITGTNLTGGAAGTATIYVLDPITRTFGSYTSGNNGIGSSTFATNIIVSGQGFLVRATAAGATLSFTESAKSVSAQNIGSLLLMARHTVQQVQPQYLRLQFFSDSVNSEQTTIRFVSQGATNATLYNALHMGGSGGVSFSSLSADNENMGINTAKLPGTQSTVIGLNVNATNNGTYIVKIRDRVAIPKLYDIWLMDAYKKDSVNLSVTNSYSVDINKADSASFGANRLSLVIRQNAALTYRLLDFTASKTQTGRNVEVQWKTENEENYTNFTVERSTNNGRSFDVLGGVKSDGSGSYSFVDKNPDNQRNFYRLKQQDLNNNITYSKVAEIQFNPYAWDKLRIFPNPATHTINLSIDERDDQKGYYDIRFMNSSGLVVRQIKSSQPDWQGNISNLMPGSYLVRVFNTKTRNLVGEKKFVKL
jgi:sugar lactone lactonase YvrE